jgi:starch phosphorylase
MFPERFSNKTTGVAPRRRLLLSKPSLSQIITEAIGDDWITDLSQLSRLNALAYEPDLCHAFRKAKRQAKAQFADWLKSTSGIAVDPDTIFDAQIKRIHEYKRQLLNALRIWWFTIACAKTPTSRLHLERFSFPARRHQLTNWQSSFRW